VPPWSVSPCLSSRCCSRGGVHVEHSTEIQDRSSHEKVVFVRVAALHHFEEPGSFLNNFSISISDHILVERFFSKNILGGSWNARLPQMGSQHLLSWYSLHRVPGSKQTKQIKLAYRHYIGKKFKPGMCGKCFENAHGRQQSF
jgi:hypothetical protein